MPFMHSKVRRSESISGCGLRIASRYLKCFPEVSALYSHLPSVQNEHLLRLALCGPDGAGKRHLIGCMQRILNVHDREHTWNVVSLPGKWDYPYELYRVVNQSPAHTISVTQGKFLSLKPCPFWPVEVSVSPAVVVAIHKESQVPEDWLSVSLPAIADLKPERRDQVLRHSLGEFTDAFTRDALDFLINQYGWPGNLNHWVLFMEVCHSLINRQVVLALDLDTVKEILELPEPVLLGVRVHQLHLESGIYELAEAHGVKAVEEAMKWNTLCYALRREGKIPRAAHRLRMLRSTFVNRQMTYREQIESALPWI